MTTEICSGCHGIGGHTSQANPARVIERCTSCGGAGEIETLDEAIRSPDCRDENCHKCDGAAWDEEAEQVIDCEHECHEEER